MRVRARILPQPLLNCFEKRDDPRPSLELLYFKAAGVIYLIFAYPKNEKASLTRAERNALYTMVKETQGE